MIILDVAKKLQPGTHIQVVTTKEVWKVEKVEMQGVLPFLHISRSRDGFQSVVRPERIHLFELAPAVDVPATAPATTVILDEEDAKHIAQRLEEQNTERLAELEKAKPVEVVNSAVKISDRLEESFTEEPVLTKPARKPRAKKAK
jgi:hypothetical protein